MKLFVFYLILGVFCISCKNQNTTTIPDKDSEVFITPLGKKTNISSPSQHMLEAYKIAKENHQKKLEDVEAIIWYGRRAAYLGRYKTAIAIYTEGIKKHPQDARLYRHRGHRYISIREFDAAITDLEKAAALIEGQENEIEPDGIPNAKNIPISSLHGNIWYHLGLAYYLKNDMEHAYKAYLNCRSIANNDDNIVSSTHWLYMIQRRMKDTIAAERLLVSIQDSMQIIENFSYYNLCKFYKKMLPADSLITNISSPQDDAMAYGLANWYFYNEDLKKAENLMREILERDSWNSFGYIAAEADYLRYFNRKE